MITLQPIAPRCAADYKAVRLRALLDSPSAFGSTYAKESLLTDADWEKRAAQWNSVDRSTAYLARDGDDACGLVAGFLDQDEPNRAHLVSMWVAPTRRRRGVGRLLVRAVLDWGKSRGAANLTLMVTSNNDAALRFYQRLGFAKTGRTEPYPNDPALLELEMIFRIGEK
jgi:ribosomal protein S18 acetylase RimI-like enzyme